MTESISYKIGQLRGRKIPSLADFQNNKEDFYKIAATGAYYEKISAQEAYKEINENLLPVFAKAKELCEYLSGDKDHFKRGWGELQMFKHLVSEDLPGDHGDRPVDRLFHMALVSRMVKTICDQSGTQDEMSHFCIQNGSSIRKGSGLCHMEEVKGFSLVMRNSQMRCNIDDCYLNEYYGAFQHDTVENENDKKGYSLSGNILDWNEMKKSAIFEIVSEPFVYNEVARLCVEDGNEYRGFYSAQKIKNYYEQADKIIQDKIAKFCDMKQAQLELKMRENADSKI